MFNGMRVPCIFGKNARPHLFLQCIFPFRVWWAFIGFAFDGSSVGILFVAERWGNSLKNRWGRFAGFFSPLFHTFSTTFWLYKCRSRRREPFQDLKVTFIVELLRGRRWENHKTKYSWVNTHKSICYSPQSDQMHLWPILYKYYSSVTIFPSTIFEVSWFLPLRKSYFCDKRAKIALFVCFYLETLYWDHNKPLVRNLFIRTVELSNIIAHNSNSIVLT